MQDQARFAPKDDPNGDMDDARYSGVRGAASLGRNASGPNTHDPRTGEILNSEINWYHNHMRSYRNRLLLETGAANPAARSLEIPEELLAQPDDLRKSYLEAVERFNRRFEEISLRNGCERVLVDTKREMAASLVDYLNQRQRQIRRR